jgi:hypothetical protein
MSPTVSSTSEFSEYRRQQKKKADAKAEPATVVQPSKPRRKRPRKTKGRGVDPRQTDIEDFIRKQQALELAAAA